MAHAFGHRSRATIHAASQRPRSASAEVEIASSTRNSRAPRLLLVEPEFDERLAIGNTLRARGYVVEEAATGTDGLLKLASGRPRLVLANLELPDMDGIELTRRIREQSEAAVIVISGRDDERSQILALDSGATDYVAKPIRAATFLARVRAVLRRSGSARSGSGAFAAGCLRADPVQSRVWLRGMEVVLTPTEFRLLNVLMQEPGRVLTHRHLLQQVWGSVHSREIQYLRVYIRQLREKIELDPGHPELLVTSQGLGYRLNLRD